MRARSASFARRSLITTASPTSCSRCRGSGAVRYPSPAAPSSRRVICRVWRAASRSRRSRSRSPMRVPMSRRSACRAQARGAEYVLDGTKTWISNGGIADFYCVFARTEIGEVRADGSTRASGISAFVVEPSDPGFTVARRIDVNAPHPLARAQVRALPDTRRSPHRRRGRGVQDGHAHPGCIPLLGRRRGDRLRAPRLRRGGGARAQAAHVR